MNEVRLCVSERVQCGTLKVASMIDEPGEAGTSDPANLKEMTMLKTISAALIATSLIAAPALAANSDTTTGTANTITQSQPTADTTAPKAAKVTSTKSKKLHTSAKTSRHHTKKISMHKTHKLSMHKLGTHKLSMHKTHAKVASKVSTKPIVHATKRS